MTIMAPKKRQGRDMNTVAPASAPHRGARSLTARFLVRVLPLLLAASLLFMLASGQLNRQAALDKVDHEIETFTSAISPVVTDLMWSYQLRDMGNALDTLASNPAILNAEVYDNNGRVVASKAFIPRNGSGQTHSAEHPLRKLLPDGNTAQLGRLVIQYTHTPAEKAFLRQFLGQLLRLLLIITCILGSALYAFRKTVSRPLRQLLDAIRETNESGNWVLVNWQGGDEIGEVIEAHNKMIRHIAVKESALADSERRHRELFNNAQVGIFRIRQDGTVKEANQTMAEILGYPSIETLQQITLTDHYVAQEDRSECWRKLLETGEIAHFRTQFRRVDGRIIWVELSGRMTPDDTLNGIMQDVTEQVEALKAVGERDELHRAFFEENKAVMLLHDPKDSSIQFVNPAACQFYGYSDQDLLAMTVRELDGMTDEEKFKELQQTAEERRNYFKQVHTLKDGTRRDVEVFAGPVSIGNRQLHYSIVHDVTEKRRLEAKLERMATRDQLTGAHNRHAFFRMAQNEIVRAARFKHPLALLMFDLDHFKRINDTHGHATGDEVLRVFALRCRADLRKNDIFARMGGEEFAALLVESDAERAMEVAERIRGLIADKPIPSETGELHITTSIGVAVMTENDTVNDLLKRADDGLYKAKETGRNSVVRS